MCNPAFLPPSGGEGGCLLVETILPKFANKNAAKTGSSKGWRWIFLGGAIRVGSLPVVGRRPWDFSGSAPSLEKDCWQIFKSREEGAAHLWLQLKTIPSKKKLAKFAFLRLEKTGIGTECPNTYKNAFAKLQKTHNRLFRKGRWL